MKEEQKEDSWTSPRYDWIKCKGGSNRIHLVMAAEVRLSLLWQNIYMPWPKLLEIGQNVLDLQTNCQIYIWLYQTVETLRLGCISNVAIS